MNGGHQLIAQILKRRTFLVAGGLGVAGLAPARGDLPTSKSGARPTADATILIWLSGGASHIDTWDMKPNAPAEFRGEFRPIESSASGIQLCEHLPLTARQAHHMTIVRSLGHYGRGTGDHHAGYYYNLTGHAPDPSFRALLNDRAPRSDDWPFLGSVVAARRPASADLPSLVTLPQKPGAPAYTRPGQFSARLGLDFDPVYVLGERDRPREFLIPALTLEGSVSTGRLASRRALLDAIDASAQSFDHTTAASRYTSQQLRAFALLSSTRSKAAFDLERESDATRARYGATINGSSLLLARRLVEAGVPFVSVFWKEDPKIDSFCKSAGGWDTHGNNFQCLREHLLPEFDRCYSALLADLHERGMLDRTLVMVTSEMGRKPRVGDVRSGGATGAGRDHWTDCMSVLFAGGGLRGGYIHGSSDKIGAYPADRPVSPEDVARSVFHAMGIDDMEALDNEGRPFRLLTEGEVIRDLFA
jgi:Protein of unknown function (DUF1501)